MQNSPHSPISTATSVTWPATIILGKDKSFQTFPAYSQHASSNELRRGYDHLTPPGKVIPQLTLPHVFKARVTTWPAWLDMLCAPQPLVCSVPSCPLSYDTLPLPLIKCNLHWHSLCLKSFTSFDHVAKSLLARFLLESNNFDKAYLDSPTENCNSNQQHPKSLLFSQD